MQTELGAPFRRTAVGCSGRCSKAEVVACRGLKGQAAKKNIVSTCKKLGYDAGMKRIIQVRIFRGEKYFVAECVDLPVVTQAATLDELMNHGHEATALQIE